MKSIEVKAKTRAIIATWTRDMVKDLSSYHSLDVEKELAILLKEELRKQRIFKRKKSINKIFQS